jgi:carboxylesterase type B
MLTNNGNQEGLFRGAVMQSGGPIPVGDIENGQQYYDHMVEATGCKRAQDTLDCLRKVPYDTYKKAMDGSPNFFAYQVRSYLSPSPSELVHDSLPGTRSGLVAPGRRCLLN